MYEALLKSTPEYQKIAESLHTPGPAALFGLPALVIAAQQAVHIELDAVFQFFLWAEQRSRQSLFPAADPRVQSVLHKFQ